MVVRHSTRTIRSSTTVDPPLITAVPVAVRIYPVPPKTHHSTRRPTKSPRPDGFLVWDTETRIDVTQRLLFGSYRFVEQGECVAEALFASDDLSVPERRVLAEYAVSEPADVVAHGRLGLPLLSRAEFLRRFFQLVYKGRAL